MVFVDEPSVATRLFAMELTHELHVLLRIDPHPLQIFIPRRQTLKLGENMTHIELPVITCGLFSFWCSFALCL